MYRLYMSAIACCYGLCIDRGFLKYKKVPTILITDMQLIYYITPPEEFCGVVVDFLDVSYGHKEDTPTTPGFIDKKKSHVTPSYVTQ